MKTSNLETLSLKLAALTILALMLTPAASQGQFFDYSGYGDLLLGFRKTGANQGNYELVVNVGNITNLLAEPDGTTIPIDRFSSSQLSGSFNDYHNLQWSVSATFRGFASWSGFALYTVWYTVPRDNPAAQTTPPLRMSGSGAQSPVRQRILSIGANAATLSYRTGTTNANNNLYLVREPTGDDNDYSIQIQDPQNPVLADFHGFLPFSVENTTPASFTASVVSDLYQAVPVNSVDPNSGTTSGDAYYVGYFTLKSDGTMTFTRASSAPSVPPPAPQIVSLQHSGSTSTVYFTTTNGTYTYSLHYTNAAGLTAPATNWPSAPTTLVGDGATNRLSDTTTDSDRFYRIVVQ